jgi:hypothetical protein
MTARSWTTLGTVAAMLWTGWAATVRAEEPAKSKTNTIKVSDGTDVDIVTPDGWTFTKEKNDSDNTQEFTLTSPNNEAVLQIIITPDTAGWYDTKAKAEKMVEKMARAGYADESVEKKVTLQDLGLADGRGTIAEFTYAETAGKKAEPGQYKVVASGAVAIGKTVVGIELQGDSFDDKYYVAAKNILKTGIKQHK